LTKLTPLPVSRNGSWEFEGLSRREARHALEEFRAAQSHLRELLARRLAERARKLPRTVDVSEALLRRNFRTYATVLFSCVAIESFVNFYGVRRFGNAFNTPTIERCSLRKKVTLILGHTAQGPVDDRDPLFVALDRLTARRNRLAHPKTHEYDGVKEPPEMETWTIAAEESVADMDAFFARFVELDPDAQGFAASF
jgi:hypothetical protein